MRVWLPTGRMASGVRPLGGMVMVLVLALLAAGVVGCGGNEQGLDRVQVASGPITGVHEGKIWSFKGIPYAAPPVGDLRWRAPQPVEPWTDDRACTAFGPACPQPDQAGVDYLAVGPTSEDCLYLNVWSPAKASTERLPVMVWIHGGSFETGAGSMAVYDATTLAGRGVVVVTINYRLGPLGFLAHPALSAEPAQGGSGNYGLLDQIAALHWVQKNIAAFGGDPQKVTVFGESAGAISILDLLVSPLADGLFQRAIVQSGILIDQGFGVSTNGTLKEAEVAGEALAGRLGVAGAGDVAAALRSKTPEELLTAVLPATNVLEQGLHWKPVADGYVLPDLPTILWAEGRYQKVDLLIGSNRDEGNIFLQGLTGDPTAYKGQMKKVFGAHVQEALTMYPVDGAQDISGAFSRMLTEVGFASSARFAARAMSAAEPATNAQPPGVFLYQFSRVPFNNPLGAFHGVEIPYVFGNTELFAKMGTIEQTDRDLSAAMMDYWTRFAATGDPNGEGAVSWPRYDAQSDRHLEFGDSITVGSGLYRAATDLADRVRGLR
ncbi:MAG: carboxylesterase/lipase family protein [Thermoleophilia bacterium]|jgi:para-nitrobenzyl esterase